MPIQFIQIKLNIITITYFFFFLKNGVLKYNYGGSESVKQCGGINKSFLWSNACEVLHFLCFREEQDELPLLIKRSPIALMQPMLKNEMASAKLAAIADIKVWSVLSSQKKKTNIHFFKGGKYTATENKQKKNRYRFCSAKPSLALSMTACGSHAGSIGPRPSSACVSDSVSDVLMAEALASVSDGVRVWVWQIQLWALRRRELDSTYRAPLWTHACDLRWREQSCVQPPSSIISH